MLTLIDLRNYKTIALSDCYGDLTYQNANNKDCDLTGYNQAVKEYIGDNAINYWEDRKKEDVVSQP